MTDDQPGLVQALGARSTIREWVRGAQVFALLETAQRAGWVEVLREPTDPAKLVSDEWPVERVNSALDALGAAGVVVRGPDGTVLAPPFAALVPGSSGVTIDAVLDAVRLELDGPSAVDDPALVVALDNGVAADPVSQALYRMVYDAIPEVDAVLGVGGPMLDLGCGVGGALLTTAQLYPELRLVGVDIEPSVVAEAERRRDELGLTDRVEIRRADARELSDARVYPVAYWAQAFFPDDARAATLAVLRRALTEDGLLLLQEQPLPADPLGAALERVRQREVTPGRTAADLASEGLGAGFILVRQIETALGNLTLLRNQP